MFSHILYVFVHVIIRKRLVHLYGFSNIQRNYAILRDFVYMFKSHSGQEALRLHFGDPAFAPAAGVHSFTQPDIVRLTFD